MDKSLITLIATIIATLLLFILPVVTMAGRVNDITQLDVETITADFVNQIQTTGVISFAKYNSFVEELNSTGNTYDVSMEVKILDENPGKKTTQTEREKIGENVYYSVYTSQIFEDKLDKGEDYILKQGDIITVTVKNTNLTIAQQFKDFVYTLSGSDTYTVSATQTGLVTANGGDIN